MVRLSVVLGVSSLLVAWDVTCDATFNIIVLISGSESSYDIEGCTIKHFYSGS